MTDTFAAFLTEDPTRIEPKANPVFRRFVHAATGRVRKPSLDRDEERALIARAQAGDEGALHTLVDNFHGFILSISHEVARRWNMQDSGEDLASEAYMAFITSVGRFRLDQTEARLASFARYHLSGAVLTYVLSNKNAYRMGTTSADRVVLLNYGQLTQRFARLHGHAFRPSSPMDIERLAALAGTSAKSVRRVVAQRAQKTVAATSVDILDHRTPESPLARISERQLGTIAARETLRVLGEMNARNREIVTAVLEAEDGAEARRRMADLHDLTPERVGQIYRAAMDKIRDRLKAHGIRSSAG